MRRPVSRAASLSSGCSTAPTCRAACTRCSPSPAAVLIFAATGVAGGSGFFAAYIAGLVVGNRPVRNYAGILSLNDAVTWLAQIVMFLVLGLLATPHRLLDLAVPSARNLAVSDLRRAAHRDLGEPAILRLRLAREDIRELGRLARRGQHLPGRDTDAGRAAARRALFRHRLLRRAGLADPAGLDDEMGGGPSRPGAAAQDRGGAAYRDRSARADRRRDGRLSRPARQPCLERRRDAVLDAHRFRRAREGDSRARRRRQAQERATTPISSPPALRVARLDSLFAPLAEASGVGDSDAEFEIHGSTPLAALATMYDLILTGRRRQADHRPALRRALRPRAGNRRPASPRQLHPHRAQARRATTCWKRVCASTRRPGRGRPPG